MQTTHMPCSHGISRARAGEEGGETELATIASRFETKIWPLPLFELYAGSRTPGATLDAAGEYSRERCEAHYYIGQWHILKRQTADAEVALRAAVETCPGYLQPRPYALMELKRLKP